MSDSERRKKKKREERRKRRRKGGRDEWKERRKREREGGSKSGRETQNKNSAMKNPDPQPVKQFKKERQNYLSKIVLYFRNKSVFQTLKTVVVKDPLKSLDKHPLQFPPSGETATEVCPDRYSTRVVNQHTKFK